MRRIQLNGEGKRVDLGEMTQPTAEEIASRDADDIRLKRNILLYTTDWQATQDRIMTQADKDYRQALRDVPQQPGFPANIVWP